MPQSKDKDWLNGYKSKTLIYAAYKRPTSKQGNTQTESEGLEKKYFMQTETKRKEELQYSYQIK